MGIKVLDNETIDKIAAGEVVERPSSIVKELVENSIDAGATAITVEIKNGGIDYIRVTDNGCGIPSKDLRTAFLRHATSKISSSEDLEKIESLGFRGEALSSIAAVSQLEVITRTEDQLTGIRLTMNGAVEADFEEVGAPCGTTMIVRNIFFNTPVRKKFLKSGVTEGSYIADLMEHLAISHPDIAIQFTNGSQSKFHTSGNGDLKEVIYRVYGREVANAIVPINITKDGIHLSGYLGKPEQVRSNRNFEIYYINGRFIRSNLIAGAIEEGFREYLMLHKFPICFMHIEIAPEVVDVNVHPTKMDVRFSDGSAVFQVISESVSTTLKNIEMIPGHVLDKQSEIRNQEKESLKEVRSGKNPEPFMASENSLHNSNLIKDKYYVNQNISASVSKTSITSSVLFKDNEDSDDFFVEEKTVAFDEKKSQAISVDTDENSNNVCSEPELVVDTLVQMNLFEEKILSQENKAKYRIIGQVFETYWLIQFERKLFIIDQHAAHEKVNYERLMNRFKNKQILSQSLMPSIIVSLSAREESIYLENADAFAGLGFEIESFGGNEYALRAVPVDLYGHEEKELFLAILDELAEGNSRGSYLAVEEKIADMACKLSVKGGDKLSMAEVEALIDELLTLENPYNCPHGRPTIIVMTESEMEKKFKRIVG